MLPCLVPHSLQLIHPVLWTGWDTRQGSGHRAPTRTRGGPSGARRSDTGPPFTSHLGTEEVCRLSLQVGTRDTVSSDQLLHSLPSQLPCP